MIHEHYITDILSHMSVLYVNMWKLVLIGHLGQITM
jgi:hypothetical protein